MRLKRYRLVAKKRYDTDIYCSICDGCIVSDGYADVPYYYFDEDRPMDIYCAGCKSMSREEKLYHLFSIEQRSKEMINLTKKERNENCDPDYTMSTVDTLIEGLVQLRESYRR